MTGGGLEVSLYTSEKYCTLFSSICCLVKFGVSALKSLRVELADLLNLVAKLKKLEFQSPNYSQFILLLYLRSASSSLDLSLSSCWSSFSLFLRSTGTRLTRISELALSRAFLSPPLDWRSSLSP